MPSHLHRRSATYYTRLIVPPKLRPIIGKSDLGRSLGTKDLAEAKRLLPHWLAEARAILAAAEAELAERARDPSAPVVSAAAYDPYANMTLEQFEDWERFQREELSEAIAEDDAEERLALPEAMLGRDDAAAAKLLKRARRERDNYRDRYRKRKERDQQRHASRASVTITGMFDGYASQPGSRKSTVQQFRAIINHLVAFLGHDDAKRVGHADLVRWREHLRSEPMKTGKPRSSKTINGSYLAAANVTFAYGKDRLLIEANPAADLAKVRTDKTPKLREKDFTKAERRAILKAAREPATGRLTPERALARRWIPWLCAYTGARVNELTQLRGKDVQQIEGFWTIRITPEAGGQKMNEARTVPIHEHLIEEGFLAAIRHKGDGPLFYDPGKERGGSDRGQHKKVGMFLADWVRNDVGVTDPGIMPNHAWRHTFKAICFEAGIEERAADAICGHASKGQGRRYGANTIPALAAQLEKFPRYDLGTEPQDGTAEAGRVPVEVPL